MTFLWIGISIIAALALGSLIWCFISRRGCPRCGAPTAELCGCFRFDGDDESEDPQ